jgi:low temperature requirement protein LtrA
MYKGFLGDGFAFLVVTWFLYWAGIARMGQEAVEERERLSEPFLGNDVATVVWHYGWILIAIGVLIHVYCVVQAYWGTETLLTKRLGWTPESRT